MQKLSYRYTVVLNKVYLLLYHLRISPFKVMHPFWQRAQSALCTNVLHLQHNTKAITEAKRTTTKKKTLLFTDRKNIPSAHKCVP